MEDPEVLKAEWIRILTSAMREVFSVIPHDPNIRVSFHKYAVIFLSNLVIKVNISNMTSTANVFKKEEKTGEWLEVRKEIYVTYLKDYIERCGILNSALRNVSQEYAANFMIHFLFDQFIGIPLQLGVGPDNGMGFKLDELMLFILPDSPTTASEHVMSLVHAGIIHNTNSTDEEEDGDQ